MELANEIAALIVATLRAGTPLVFAALGELVAEKTGVLNLGVEGMMLMGAVAAMLATLATGSYAIGILAGLIAGAALSAIFAFVALILRASQVPTGLALTIFGIGLSAFIGVSAQDKPVDGLKPPFEALADIPIVGPLLFGHDPMVYLSLTLFGLVAWVLARTRLGLVLRAVGENPAAADALGYKVVAIRFLATLFGGAMGGLGGAYLTMVYTPMWAEDMTAGRGWIALALVVFATWRPGWVLIGAYLFGAVTIAQLGLQASGVDLPAQLLSMLPYLATIVVLVIISSDATRIRLNAPASLGKPFYKSG